MGDEAGASPQGRAAAGGYLDRLPLAVHSTATEEVASGLTHALATVGAVVAAFFLLRLAVGIPHAPLVCTVFLLSLVNLYAVSTLYHFVRNERSKRLLRLLDHLSILYLIAGSYTVVAGLFLTGAIRPVILIVEWSLALVGTLSKILFFRRLRVLSLVLYLVMGWLALAAWPQMLALRTAGLNLWLLGGGIAYTAGLTFFGMKRMPYNHALWHLFVMVGSACHLIGIFGAMRVLAG